MGRSLQALVLPWLLLAVPVDGDDPPAAGAALEQQVRGGSEQALRRLIDGLEAVRRGPIPIAEIAKKLAADMEAARMELQAVRLELESARKAAGSRERSKQIEERIAALESREERVLARLDASRITLVLLTKKLPRPEALQLLAAVTPQPEAIDPAKAEKSRVLYRDRVGPLLAASCLRCHDEKKKKGELVLQSREQALIGGAQGPAITPGKPDASLLFLHVSGSKEPLMPPGKKLPSADVEAIREWIQSGAFWVYPEEREF